MIDPDNNIAEVNPAAEIFFGTGAKQLIARSYSISIDSHDG